MKILITKINKTLKIKIIKKKTAKAKNFSNIKYFINIVKEMFAILFNSSNIIL